MEKKLKQKLEFLAGHDELTGCFNLRLLLRVLEKEVMRSKRYEKEMTISLVDIDNFKGLNDHYGHLVGNDVLKAFTRIVNDNIRSEDIVGRYGGDEFVVVFPESNAQQVKVVLERIKANLQQTKISSAYLSEGEGVEVVFSAGIASFPHHGREMNKLISAADNALYRAKQAGRNRIFIENKDVSAME